ncbi:DUF6283 family protein [Methylosinus sporium]|uniref:Uncharacterized protein n=2 Tax=Methylosinus sporium TaxID=428 RepID=A0A2U1SSV6_METSR|nr:hypothetical protein C5689_06480 [Methylosinus sporium]
MREPFRLKRTRQCKKCPWKVTTDPHDIPSYSEALHRELSRTIASPDMPLGSTTTMACHEHAPADEMHCVGWLTHQLGPGNNIPLRMRMRDCENAREIALDGAQHKRFEDTLPRGNGGRRYG